MKFRDLTLSTPYLELDTLMYSRVAPTPLKNPFLISVSQNAAALLGIDEDVKKDTQLLKILNGEEFLSGSEPFAMAYAGHQFGQFAGVLGDGRVINLGKVKGWNLQLKGSGKTPYSRQGDGRAVLRSSLREYLISEAMAGLDIPTSRALALMGSESEVARQEWERGAMVLRLSSTWVRFGTFEYLNAIGEYAKIKELADYVLEESFSHLLGSEQPYVALYKEIVIATATTVALWQSVGFVHGVMNSDNMAIDGTTIDYGPFAFLDDYSSTFVSNKTDTEGRYSFASQRGAAYWNLDMLSRALAPLVEREVSEAILEEYFEQRYEAVYKKRMLQKLGLEVQDEEDDFLVALLLRSLESAVIDYTRFFRRLSFFDGNKEEILSLARVPDSLSRWLDRYIQRLQKERLLESERHQKMRCVNPKYILKNHLLQDAIRGAEEGDFRGVEELLEVAYAPFDEHSDLEHLTAAPPLQMKNQKLSCSS